MISPNIYILLIILTDWTVLIESDNMCPRLCRCDPKKLWVKCMNNGKQLTDIPNLPSYLRTLYIISNYFPIITNDTLEFSSSRKLTSLTVKSSGLRHLTENCFRNLIRLQNLDLSSNLKLNIRSLKLALRSLQRKVLGNLSFNYMNWTSQHLSTRIFEYLAGRKVNKLALIGNNIDSWLDTASVGLKNVSKLSLSRNKLKTFKHLSSLLSLEHLDVSNNMFSECDLKNIPKHLVSLRLSHNYLKKFPNVCSDNNTALLPKLEKLQLDFNDISTIRYMFQPCFPSLKYLTLSGNNIKMFDYGTFSVMPRLLYLHLDRMQKGVRFVCPRMFQILSLKALYFNGNNFPFQGKDSIPLVSLTECKELETLDLSHNRLPQFSRYIRRILQGLDRLRTLRLINVGWSDIPDGFFKMFPSLEKVSLAQNGISQLNNIRFPDNIKIREMFLNGNKISNVGSGAFSESFWKSVKRIDLSGNPYVCNCDLLWFRKKLRSASTIFHEYPKKYICSSPTELSGLKISKFNLTDDDCRRESVLLIALSSSGSICIFAGILLFCMYIARWHIRYWVYLLLFRRGESAGIYVGKDDYKYDAFISYAEEDGNFVHNVLLHKLEKENGYKLCVHARDFEAGKVIVDNIVENISSSRQVLLVMSHHFCKSKWCKFEQLIALDRWLNNESEPIVIIMLEEITVRNMNKDMRFLLKTTTYAQWTSNGIGQEVFWNQLLSSLRGEQKNE